MYCPPTSQVRSMKRARDIRDQLVGLMERVEIEMTSDSGNHDGIKKAVAAGFFYNTARLQKDGSYKTVKHPQTVHIHPSSSLSQVCGGDVGAFVVLGGLRGEWMGNYCNPGFAPHHLNVHIALYARTSESGTVFTVCLYNLLKDCDTRARMRASICKVQSTCTAFSLTWRYNHTAPYRTVLPAHAGTAPLGGVPGVGADHQGVHESGE